MRNFILLMALMLSLTACSVGNPPANNGSTLDHKPTYSTNGSYDDNGIEPSPNNGNQNFGFGAGR